MYLVINKSVTAVKVSNFSGHYLRNRSTLDIGVSGYIGIVQHKERPPEVWHIPPGTPCIVCLTRGASVSVAPPRQRLAIYIVFVRTAEAVTVFGSTVLAHTPHSHRNETSDSHIFECKKGSLRWYRHANNEALHNAVR